LIRSKDNILIFDFKLASEHIATPYYALSHAAPDQETWLKITLKYYVEYKPAPYVILIIQNVNFNNMFSLPCYDPDEP